jgi:hypothetical protein
MRAAWAVMIAAAKITRPTLLVSVYGGSSTSWTLRSTAAPWLRRPPLREPSLRLNHHHAAPAPLRRLVTFTTPMPRPSVTGKNTLPLKKDHLLSRVNC